MTFLLNPYWFGGPWTPGNITTALWLDAADSATVTTVSGNISQWNDKSGNNRNALQATAASRPTYAPNLLNGLPGVSFDGVSDWLESGSVTLLAANETKYTLACVWSYASNETLASLFTHSYATNVRNIGIQLNTAGGSIFNFYCGNNSVTYMQGTRSTSAGINVIAYNGADSTAANRLAVRTNGTQITLTTGAGTIPSSLTATTGSYQIGRTLANYELSCILYEFIIVPSSYNVLVFQRLEGYLAWKWGLTSSLPADHLYKSAPPTV